MARGLTRAHHAQLSQSIQAGHYSSLPSEASEVLRPTQKSVQAMRSRTILLRLWLTQARSLIVRGGTMALAIIARQRPRLSTIGRAVARRVGQRLRRSRSAPLPQPETNIDALFTPTAPTNIKTRLIDTATPVALEPTVQPLHVLRHEHAPQKKMSALQRAEAALHDKNYQHAEGILVDHIVHHTKDTKAYMLLGQIALAKTDWTEAMEIFEQVVHLGTHEPGAQAGLGQAAYNCGRYSKALPALQRAHEEDPHNRTVLAELLAIAQKMDNPALQRSIQSKLTELAAEQPSVNQAH